MKKRSMIVSFVLVFFMILSTSALVDALTCSIAPPAYDPSGTLPDGTTLTPAAQAFATQIYNAFFNCLSGLPEDSGYTYKYSSTDTLYVLCPDLPNAYGSYQKDYDACRNACTYESDYTGCVNTECREWVEKGKAISCYYGYDKINDPCPRYASETNFNIWKTECEGQKEETENAKGAAAASEDTATAAQTGSASPINTILAKFKSCLGEGKTFDDCRKSIGSPANDRLEEVVNALYNDAKTPAKKTYYNMDNIEITEEQAQSTGVHGYVTQALQHPTLKAGENFKMEVIQRAQGGLGKIIVTTKRDVVSGTITVTATEIADTPALLRGPEAGLDQTGRDILSKLPSKHNPIQEFKISSDQEQKAQTDIFKEALFEWHVKKDGKKYDMLRWDREKDNWLDMEKNTACLESGTNAEYMKCITDPALSGYYAIVIDESSSSSLKLIFTVIMIIVIAGVIAGVFFGYRSFKKKNPSSDGSSQPKPLVPN